MKETFYFSHDYNAQHDEKILKLMADLGWEGYGLFWGLIEKLYGAGGYLTTDYKSLSFGMRTQYERIQSVIEDYELFAIQDSKFYSKSVLERLTARKERSEKARISVQKRWGDTNVLRSQYDTNTIKENKIKENKYINVLKNGAELVLKDGLRVKKAFGKIIAAETGADVSERDYPEIKNLI